MDILNTSATTKFYKITNEKENHFGFQYYDGLNILKEEFNDDPSDQCCGGGLYFADLAHIFHFLDYGVHVREVILPIGTPNFQMVKCGKKYRANMLILGKRYDLNKIETYKMLLDQGADIHAGNDYALRWNVENSQWHIVKYLIEAGANIHIGNDNILTICVRMGNIDMVKYLIEHGANVHAMNDYALYIAAKQGHLKIIKYLVENGANLNVIESINFKMDTSMEDVEIIRYLIEQKTKSDRQKIDQRKINNK